MNEHVDVKKKRKKKKKICPGHRWHLILADLIVGQYTS